MASRLRIRIAEGFDWKAADAAFAKIEAGFRELRKAVRKMHKPVRSPLRKNHLAR